MKVRFFSLLLFTIVLCSCAYADVPGIKRDFTYKKTDKSVDVSKKGKLVARYVFKDTQKPYIYPLNAPNGELVTQMPASGDPAFMRSLWIGHADVNGVNFWNENSNSGKIVQTSLDFDSLSPGYWNIHTKNDWIGPDGKKVCEDERRFSFLSCDYGTLMSVMVTITSTSRELKLEDTKDALLAFRLAPGMQIKDSKASILNADGKKGIDCNGITSAWCDFTGEINGKVCGVTLFDSTIINSPSYWNIADNGLVAINPFGGKALTGDVKKDSTLTLPYRKTATFVYVFLIHDENLDAENINSVAEQVTGKGIKDTRQSADSPQLLKQP